MADDVWEVGDFSLARDGQPGAEVIPEGDAELCAGLGEAEEGVAAVAAGVASGAGADLAPDDLAANVVFRSVGVERDVGRSSTISNSPLLA